MTSGQTSGTRFPVFGSLRVYRYVSLVLSVSFAMVGLLFLFFPQSVLTFFNGFSRSSGFAESPVQDSIFYGILAVGYMYIVTYLAFRMYRFPQERLVLILLINAKAASAIISFGLFVVHHPFLIYITNGVVDGSIAVLLMAFSVSLRRVQS